MTAPYINGQTIEVDPAAMTPVINPASGKAFSKVFMARPEHMTRAIDAAFAVKDVWGNTLPSGRIENYRRRTRIRQVPRNVCG
jgi:acyl-CoA reductase-like NAD-dependent aldehyde dehydrogenase